jgi:phosphoglycerol transferase
LKVISRHPDVFSAAAAGGLAVLGVTVAQELWRINSAIPLGYISDGQLFLSMTKATLEHGWYLNPPELGFPLGSEWHDYPVATGDTLHLLLLHALSPLSSNYITVLHVFYVLGYALTAISAFAVLRLLQISRGPAIVCGTLFALLPYHFALNEAHPFVTAYWVVPIASFLVLALLLDRPLLRRREDASGLLAYASGTTFATLAACIVIGSAGSNYYSVFAAGLVLLAGLIAGIRFDWRRSFATAGVVFVAIVAVIGLNSLPNLIYEAEHGANGQVANRLPEESEYYSLSLFGMLAPSSGHRIAAFDEIRSDYATTSPTPVAAAATGVGLVAALGLLWLFAFALASLLKPSSWAHRWRLHGAAAAAALMAFLIATTGGLSLLFAHLVTPQVRTWHRMHIFIAFFALLAVAALLDLAIRRLRSARHGRVATWALLVGVLVVGFLDQTNPSYVPAYDEMRQEFASDAAFFDSIEDELGPDAAVFQLPYVPFPEWWPTSGMQPFDNFRGYLHTDNVRWSFGATTARPEDWQPGVVDERVEQVLPRLIAVGFDGLVVDRRGYPDEGEAVEAAIRQAVGEQPRVAPDARFAFFDLRAYGEELGLTRAESEQLRSDTLSPLLTEAGAGLARYVPPNGNYSPNFRLAGTTAQLGLVNSSERGRDAMLELWLAPDAQAAVDVALPTGASSDVRPGHVLRERISLPPGTTMIELNSAGGAGPGRIGARLYGFDLHAVDRSSGGVAVQP